MYRVNLQSVTDSICQGDDLTASITNVDYDDFSWQLNSLFQSYSDNLVWSSDTSGILNLHVTRSNPYCSADTTVTISIFPRYSQYIDSVAICSGETALLFGLPQTITGDYYNHLFTVNGCDSTEIIHLAVMANPVVNLDAAVDTTLCLEGSFPLVLPDALPLGGTYSGIGVTGNTFTPTGINDYTIHYIFMDTNGCQGSDSLILSVASCLGLEDNQLSDWRIYPNPADQWVNVDFPFENGQLEVTDALGKSMLSKAIGSTNQLSLQGLPDGIYFFKLVGPVSFEVFRVVKKQSTKD